MDEFGVLTERFGLKPQGKSAPMAAAKQSASRIPNSSYGGADAKAQKSGSFVDDFDIFGGFQNNPNGSQGSSFDYDSIFGSSSAKASFDDDIFGGISSLKNSSSSNKDDIFGSFSSRSPNPNANPSSVDDLLGNFGVKDQSPSQNGSGGFDEFLGNFGLGSASTKRENVGTTKSTFTSSDDPFVVFESSSTKSNSAFTDPLVEFKFNHSGNAKPSTTSSVSSPLKPPPKPGQVLKAHIVKSSAVSSIDELEDFATGRVQKTAGGFSNARPAKPSKYREAEDAKQKTQQKSADDLESFFSMSSRSSSAPKSRATTSINSKNKPEVAPKKSTGGSSGIKKASSTTNIVDDLSSVFGDAQLFGEFEDVAGESEERRQARLGRHMRTQDRVAKAVADMNQRDFQTQQEQEERSRIADRMDFEIKRWAAGKEGNLRALLSSLQYVLWPECGWEPVSLTDLITSTSVKKVYRKATLCVHPDKVQQKGATIEQKYTAEKVFDILKEAWNKFNKEELS